jgi:hypothetical protein
VKKSFWGIILASLLAIVGCGGEEKDLNKDLKPVDRNITPFKDGSERSGGGGDQKGIGEKPAPILK